MFEAIMISVTGGLIGVVLGISMAFVVSEFIGIKTIVTVSAASWKSIQNQNPINRCFGKFVIQLSKILER